MATNFTKAVEYVLGIEKGYVNDPDDSGGETNYGISKSSYPQLDIKNLTRSEAIDIYHKDYWLKGNFDKVNDYRLATLGFSVAVSSGVKAGGKILQKACNLLGANLVVDGVLGTKSIQKINGYKYPKALLTAARYYATDYYRSCRNAHKYLAGWLGRIADP